jgi:hypothetical protein
MLTHVTCVSVIYTIPVSYQRVGSVVRFKMRYAVGAAAIGAAAFTGVSVSGVTNGNAAPPGPPAPRACAIGGGTLPSGDAARTATGVWACTDGTWVRLIGYGN